MGARTGQQFLDGLRKTPRTVWLGDERVDDVTAHQTSTNCSHPNRLVDSILAAGRAPEVPSNREGG